MGKGPKGTQQADINRTETDLGRSTYGGAENANNIMWGDNYASPPSLGNTGNYGGPINNPNGGGYAGAGTPNTGARQRNPNSGVNGGFNRGNDIGNSDGVNPSGGGGDPQQLLQGLIGNKPLNTATMKEIEPQLSQHGLKFVWNADGTRPDLVLPNGQQIDFVSNMGGAPGTQSFQWSPVSGSEGGGGNSGSGGGQFGSNGVQAGGVAGKSLGDYDNIQNRYAEFADTGGYSPETLDAIRSRSLSPIRAAYSDANREMDRSRSQSGGYSPNYTAAKAKAAREQAYTTADASTNTEAGIGQMVQQGRLAGIGGMSSMYGSTPGLANMFGNQALASRGLANNFGLGLIGARQGQQQLPSGFDSTLGRIGRLGGAVSGISGLPGLNRIPGFG